MWIKVPSIVTYSTGTTFDAISNLTENYTFEYRYKDGLSFIV